MFNKKSLIYLFFTAITALIIVLLVGYWYLDRFSKTIIYTKSPDQIFTLKRGTSVYQLSQQMAQELTLENANLVPYFVRLTPSLQHIKAGSYQLPDSLTVQEFLQLLNHGKEVQFAVKFIEGKQAQNYLDQLDLTSNIHSELIGKSTNEIAQQLGLDMPLEGWLYPDTYYYANNTTDLMLLKRAYQRMKITLDEIWQNRDAELPYHSPYELLIMASIIEKETSVDNERGKVASVFVNRLKYKMRLQTDPTVIYGMGTTYQGKLTKANLNDKNNIYNTYVINGLPPTPIASPSLASLKAAAHPDKTHYLYFVADGYGGHVFSKNYKDHSVAVQQYWKLVRERQNKQKF